MSVLSIRYTKWQDKVKPSRPKGPWRLVQQQVLEVPGLTCTDICTDIEAGFIKSTPPSQPNKRRSAHRPAGTTILLHVVLPHLPPVVEVLHNLSSVLDVTLRHLLVQREAVDCSNTLLKVAVNNGTHVTLTQLKLHEKQRINVSLTYLSNTGTFIWQDGAIQSRRKNSPSFPEP